MMATEPSELSIYTSEYLTEQERRFLIDNLAVKSVEFSGVSNAQIFARYLMHDTKRQIESNSVQTAVVRGKETILAFHAFSSLTTSWTWIKFAMSLFREGFNVILIDLPGFGKSSVARDVHCSHETWKNWDVGFLVEFLTRIHVGKVNVLACYESVPILFHLFTQAPQILGKQHFIHNVCLLCDFQTSRSHLSPKVKYQTNT